LFGEAAQSPDSEKAVPAMLGVIERLPDAHFWFMYLVRHLEECVHYEPYVVEAVQQNPTPLTVMAANRLKKRPEFDAPQIDSWIQNVLTHPRASVTTQEVARRILNARPIAAIIEDFQHFTPTENDFNFKGRAILRDLCNEVLDTPDPALAIPAMLQVIENNPDADLGAPGELVNTLEEISGYETLLIESIQRRPAPLAVEMVNRLLNSAQNELQKATYLTVLKWVVDNPMASDDAKGAAAFFISQQKR
jgi:hypothetical protein